MSLWQQHTGRAACVDDPKGTKYYEDNLGGAGGATAARLDFLTARVFASCSVVSTHIDASLVDALPPAVLAETLIVVNTREPFERLVSEYSHNWLWERSVGADTLNHVTFDEFLAATYAPPPPPGEGPAAAAAAAARQATLRSLVGRQPSMVLQHGGLRLSNPIARRLTGFTDFGQSGADSWAAAPVPPGQPPRPTPGLTGPVVPGTPAWDTGGDDLLGAALQRLETRVCAVVSSEHLASGLDYIAMAMGWGVPAAPSPPLRHRNSAARLGRLRNVTAREIAAGLPLFAASEGVDEALHRVALGRHYLQVDELARRRVAAADGVTPPPPPPGRDDPSLTTVPALLRRAGAGSGRPAAGLTAAAAAAAATAAGEPSPSAPGVVHPAAAAASAAAAAAAARAAGGAGAASGASIPRQGPTHAAAAAGFAEEIL